MSMVDVPKPAHEMRDVEGQAAIELPATLRDSLMAQLDRIGEAKTVAQTAAVLGRGFERPLLKYVWEGDEQSLETGLGTCDGAGVERIDRCGLVGDAATRRVDQEGCGFHRDEAAGIDAIVILGRQPCICRQCPENGSETRQLPLELETQHQPAGQSEGRGAC